MLRIKVQISIENWVEKGNSSAVPTVIAQVGVLAQEFVQLTWRCQFHQCLLQQLPSVLVLHIVRHTHVAMKLSGEHVKHWWQKMSIKVSLLWMCGVEAASTSHWVKQLLWGTLIPRPKIAITCRNALHLLRSKLRRHFCASCGFPMSKKTPQGHQERSDGLQELEWHSLNSERHRDRLRRILALAMCTCVSSLPTMGKGVERAS